MSIVERLKSHHFWIDNKLYRIIQKTISKQKKFIGSFQRQIDDTQNVLVALTQTEKRAESTIVSFFRDISWAPEDAQELFYDLKQETQIEEELGDNCIYADENFRNP